MSSPRRRSISISPIAVVAISLGAAGALAYGAWRYVSLEDASASDRWGEFGEAMLFPFETEGRHSFWMQGMKFPIDIIWLDSAKTVVHIEPQLEPCTPLDCPSYQPDQNAMYVLETVAGFSEKWGVTEGTRAEFHIE